MSNIKLRILLYDLIVGLIFLTLSRIIVKVNGFLCACSYNIYASRITFLAGLFFILALCFLNHLKNKKEPSPKWYAFIPYMVVAIILFPIVVFSITPIFLSMMPPNVDFNSNF